MKGAASQEPRGPNSGGRNKTDNTPQFKNKEEYQK